MEQAELRAPDLYGRTFQVDEQMLNVIAARLEARAQHRFLWRVIDECLANDG